MIDKFSLSAIADANINQYELDFKGAQIEAISIIDVKFKEVEYGDIKFNKVDMVSESGFTVVSDTPYLITDGVYDDIFISNRLDNMFYSTLLHEIGHALGLKHPNNYGNDGASSKPPYMPSSEDNITYTTMSYIHNNDYQLYITLNGNSYTYGITPIDRYTYSAYDIDALKYTYGSNITNMEDNIYKFDGVNFYTIDDTIGYDTIDLSTTKNNFINLYTSFDTIDAFGYQISDRLLSSVNYSDIDTIINDKIALLNVTLDEKEQIYNTVSKWINDNNYENLIYTGKDNLSFSQNTVIEKYIGGIGKDTVIDNMYDNTILTGKGDDKIIILGGDDYIDGGDGWDILYINGYKKDFQISNNMLISENEIIKYDNIEQIYFIDTYYL